MFKIHDGREHFYQWDLDRKLIVEDPTITEVHFCNRTDNCSLVCETFLEDGITLVNVPNILLQTDWKIRVYAYDGSYTKHDSCFEVKSRTKPSDYIYTETELKNYDDLEAYIKAVDEKYAKDKWVAFEEIPQTYYYFSKNDDGSWSANSDFWFSNIMKVGETYKFISDLVTMEITLDNWDGGYFKAYSEDGKAELWLTGILIETEEDVEYWGYPIGTFYGVQALIYYDSAIGEPIFGVPMEEIPWESDGWTGECYFYECDMNVEHLEAQKIDYRYLPEDIATKDDIPENLESTTYKIQSINDMNEEADKQYPSASLFLNELIKFEQSGRDYIDSTYGNVFGDINILQAQTNWELVDVNTLTEDVVQITPRMYSEHYKELYWEFEIPPMSTIDSADKGRIAVYPSINPINTGLKLIQQGAPYTDNYTKSWVLCIATKVIGSYGYTELWYSDDFGRNGAYGQTPNTNKQNGIVMPYQLLTKDYIDALTIAMSSTNGGRVFPKGTKYELWGLKK